MSKGVKAFDSFEEIVSRAKRDSETILTKHVSPIVKSILRRHIQTDIYDVYSPKKNGWVHGTTYKRRKRISKMIDAFMEYDGDDAMLVVTSTEDASESVVPGYSFSNRYAGSFLELLGSGHMGIWRNGFARPAVENAQDDIETDPKVDNAIESGIQKYMGDYIKF